MPPNPSLKFTVKPRRVFRLRCRIHHRPLNRCTACASPFWWTTASNKSNSPSREALRAAGAVTAIVSPQTSTVQGWNSDEKGDAFPVDVSIADANPTDFDALLLPGGVRNPDKLRTNNKAVLFAHAMEVARKPIAAICHGPWLLVETGFVRDRKMTSWPSLRNRHRQRRRHMARSGGRS